MTRAQSLSHKWGWEPGLNRVLGTGVASLHPLVASRVTPGLHRVDANNWFVGGRFSKGYLALFISSFTRSRNAG
jgi:hypothetical protein